MMTNTNPKDMLNWMGLYRTDGRNGLVYDLPAIVTCTTDSHPGDYPCRFCGGVNGDEATACPASEGPTQHGCDRPKNPLMVPDAGHVHLTVFTPGGFGTVPFTDEQPARPMRDADSEDYVGASTFSPGSGTYVELNVEVVVEPQPRTWRP